MYDYFERVFEFMLYLDVASCRRVCKEFAAISGRLLALDEWKSSRRVCPAVNSSLRRVVGALSLRDIIIYACDKQIILSLSCVDLGLWSCLELGGYTQTKTPVGEFVMVLAESRITMYKNGVKMYEFTRIQYSGRYGVGYKMMNIIDVTHEDLKQVTREYCKYHQLSR